MPLERLGTVDIDGRAYPIELVEAGVEVPVDHETAVLDAKRRGDSLVITHTEVPKALRGKGIAEAMAGAVLDYARRNSLTVKPYCPFVAKYIARNPEYKDLIDPGFHPASDV
jgi:predicted GNAT family acetyltransferase